MRRRLWGEGGGTKTPKRIHNGISKGFTKGPPAMSPHFFQWWTGKSVRRPDNLFTSFKSDLNKYPPSPMSPHLFRLSFIVYRLSFVVCRLSFIVYRLSFVVYRLSFIVYRFFAYRLSFVVHRIVYRLSLCAVHCKPEVMSLMRV